MVRLLGDAGELGLRGGAIGFAEPLPPPPQLDKMAQRHRIAIYLKNDRDLSICKQAPYSNPNNILLNYVTLT
tara:strand:+ start:2562 stop:2777 length:216 start_codon:yes stop_codon:yes gene_type:complete